MSQTTENQGLAPKTTAPATAAVAAAPHGGVTAAQIRTVGVVVLGAFLALLNQTVMSPALPVIMSDLGIEAGTAQWIMSIYPLVSGIMVPISAFLIDRFSTRALFFSATGVFAAGTLLCAIAPSFGPLIVGRVLQAASSGVLLPLVAVVPLLVFPVEKRGTAMGLAGIVMAAGPAVGPVVGGAVIDSFGWRVMLGAIVPLALIVLVCGVVFLKNVGERKNPQLDVASVILSTIAFGGLLYGFSSASSLGWTSPIVCLVCFVRRSLSIENPLLELTTLKTPSFRTAALVVTLINAACLVTNTTLPILLQTALGASAFETGMVMLPAAAVGIVLSPVAGMVFDRFGPRAISVAGLALMTVALFLFSGADENMSVVTAAVLCGMQACGQSMANMPVNTWGVNALRDDLIAHGNAIANTGRQVAGGLATALIVTAMTGVTSAQIASGVEVAAATAAGVGSAYFICGCIGAVALVFAIFCVKHLKHPAKQAA